VSVFLANWGLNALGWAMLTTSLGAKIVGLPQQIRQSWRTKTAPHGLRWFMYLGFASYLTQAVYNGLEHVWLTCAAASPGVALAGIIIVQMRLYPAATTPVVAMAAAAAPGTTDVSKVLLPHLIISEGIVLGEIRAGPDMSTMLFLPLRWLGTRLTLTRETRDDGLDELVIASPGEAPPPAYFVTTDYLMGTGTIIGGLEPR
jgi:hypothetical protein